MPEAEIHVISTLEKLDARPADSALDFRNQQNDVKSRVRTLFSDKGMEKDLAQDDEEAERLLKEDYETVNEALTSDTTEAPGQATRRTELSESVGGAPDKKAEQQEGILSSDEETTPTEQVNKMDKPISQASSKPDIRAFEGAESLFSSEKAKEEIENKFSFSEQDLEYFGARIQQKVDRDSVRSVDADDEDKQFVGETDYSQDVLDKLDVSSLNLFGQPLDDTVGQDSMKDVATNKETQAILRELVEIASELDGGSISDFSQRKAFTYYNPYQDDPSVRHTAYFKFEDESRLRASVVLDVYKKQVEAIPDSALVSQIDKERKAQVLKLIDYIGSLKIVDAPVLSRLYEMYRYKI